MHLWVHFPPPQSFFKKTISIWLRFLFGRSTYTNIRMKHIDIQIQIWIQSKGKEREEEIQSGRVAFWSLLDIFKMIVKKCFVVVGLQFVYNKSTLDALQIDLFVFFFFFKPEQKTAAHCCSNMFVCFSSLLNSEIQKSNKNPKRIIFPIVSNNLREVGARWEILFLLCHLNFLNLIMSSRFCYFLICRCHVFSEKSDFSWHDMRTVSRIDLFLRQSS